jgi:hypothetical protein
LLWKLHVDNLRAKEWELIISRNERWVVTELFLHININNVDLRLIKKSETKGIREWSWIFFVRGKYKKHNYFSSWIIFISCNLSKNHFQFWIESVDLSSLLFLSSKILVFTKNSSWTHWISIIFDSKGKKQTLKRFSFLQKLFLLFYDELFHLKFK